MGYADYRVEMPIRLNDYTCGLSAYDPARFARQAPSSSLMSSGWRSRIVIN